MASIRERSTKAGERTWAVLYRHGGRQTSMTFATKKAAGEFRALVDVLGPDRALKALDADGQDDRLTVSELANRFLEWKSRDVTERTMIDYRRDVKNWIEPWFGHRAAELIDETDVQQWVDHMAGKLEPKSVADRHMLLHSMYQFGKAKSRKLVTHNPCQETALPRRVKKPPKGTTVPAYRAILGAADERNPDAEDLIVFLGETGWRFSEGAALDVAYVEDDGADVFVTVGQVFRIDGNHRQVIAVDEAKSYAAFRRIRLFPESAAIVRRRVVGKRPGELVFTNSRGTPWSQNTFLRSTWPGIVKAAGLWHGPRKSPTPHWLRHMHVAVLAAAGVPMQEIQRRIGHESIQTTINVYGGLIGDISDDSLARASGIMAGRISAPTIAASEVVLGELVSDLGEPA
jgi:integrase